MRRRGGAQVRVRNEASDAARERLARNPFFVLELRPSCTRAEIERAGQKLLGMLELEFSAARRYRSPIGEHERSAELVRASMAELRDPNRRLLHELWAALEPGALASGAGDGAGDGAGAREGRDAEDGDAVDLSPFPALAALGFGGWFDGGGEP